jgi:hypothetical protein
MNQDDFLFYPRYRCSNGGGYAGYDLFVAMERVKKTDDTGDDALWEALRKTSLSDQLKNESKFFYLVREHCMSQKNYGWNLSCFALSVCLKYFLILHRILTKLQQKFFRRYGFYPSIRKIRRIPGNDVIYTNIFPHRVLDAVLKIIPFCVKGFSNDTII